MMHELIQNSFTSCNMIVQHNIFAKAMPSASVSPTNMYIAWLQLSCLNGAQVTAG